MGSSFKLKGAENDAYNFAYVLKQSGSFKDDEIRLLKEGMVFRGKRRSFYYFIVDLRGVTS